MRGRKRGNERGREEVGQITEGWKVGLERERRGDHGREEEIEKR